MGEATQELNKLTKARGVIDKALEVQKQQKIPLPDALKIVEAQERAAAEAGKHDEFLAEMYRRGEARFEVRHPNYKLFTPTKKIHPALFDYLAKAAKNLDETTEGVVKAVRKLH